MNLFYTDMDLARNEEKRKAIKDTLSDLKESTPWDIFLPIMKKAFQKKPPKAPGGRPAFSMIIMLKILILQRVYNLSDDQMEYQILDRNSFKDFLDLKADASVPDAKTIWYYRNQLAQNKYDLELFKAFHDYLEKTGKIVKQGVLVDASFVEVPKAHFTKEEKEEMQSQESSEEGSDSEGNQQKTEEKPQEPPKTPQEIHRQRQMDRDARWTQKHGKSYFGYKNHVKVDVKSKLVTGYKVTPASVNDSPVLPDLIKPASEKGQEVYADKGYTSDNNSVYLKANKMKDRILKKAARGRPLTESEKLHNKELSKIRARVEHVFGFMENSMNGMRQRAKGLTRISFITGTMNLTYNIMRYEYLCRGRSAQ